jgi:DNA-binding protein YbaB
VTAELPPLVSGPATPEINAALRARVADLLGQYDQVKRNVGELRQRLREAEGRAQSKDGSVKLTVGPRGELRTLELDPKAYRRFSPSELAAEILELSGTAAEEVRTELDQAMAPFRSPGLSLDQVANGEVDPAAWRPSEASMRQLLDSLGFGA